MKNKSLEKYLIYIGIPLICILGVINHFVFDVIYNVPLVGIFFPTNESVWEHLKLSFYPIILIWIIGHFKFRKKLEYDPRRWFIAMVFTAVVSVIFTIVMHYTAEGIFGKLKPVVDITIFILSIAFSQNFGLWYYKNAHYSEQRYYFSIFLLVLFFTAFILFTYYPPKIPLFYDTLNKKYGMVK